VTGPRFSVMMRAMRCASVSPGTAAVSLADSEAPEVAASASLGAVFARMTETI